MADDNHEMGSMDITEHNRTWNMFMKMTTYGTVATLAVVFLLMFMFS